MPVSDKRSDGFAGRFAPVLVELMEELERKLEAYTNPESLINNQSNQCVFDV